MFTKTRWASLTTKRSWNQMSQPESRKAFPFWIFLFPVGIQFWKMCLIFLLFCSILFQLKHSNNTMSENLILSHICPRLMFLLSMAGAAWWCSEYPLEWFDVSSAWVKHSPWNSSGSSPASQALVCASAPWCSLSTWVCSVAVCRGKVLL